MKDGVKAVIICDHKILLFLRDDKPECKYPLHWQIVGGAIEESEKPEEALVREVGEETSYEVRNFSSLGRTIGSQGEAVYRYLIKVNKQDKGKFKVGPDEGLDVKFFSLTESLKLELTPGTRNFLEEKRKEFEEWVK